MRQENISSYLVLCSIIALSSWPAAIAQTDAVAQAPASDAAPSAPASTSTPAATSAPAPAASTSSAKPKKHHFHKMKAKKAKTVRKKKHAVSTSSGKLHGGVSKHHKPKKQKKAPGTISTGQQKRLNKLNAFLKNPPPASKKLPEIGEPGSSVPMTSP